MVEKSISKSELAQKAGIGNATITKMTKGESVNLSILEKIIKALGDDFTFGDLVKYVPDADGAGFDGQ